MTEQPGHDDAPGRDPGCWRSGKWVLIWSAVVLAAMAAQSMLLRHAGPWPRAAEVAIALSPIAAFAGLFGAMWRHMRWLDEMQQRMQLESLGLTVIVASLICLAFGQLQKIGVIGLAMLDDAWAIIAFTYVASCVIVKLRYR